MTRRLREFEAGIQRARDLVGLGQSIGNMTNGVVDAQDLYRAALVQAVSALDHYAHGVVLDLAVEAILGTRTVGSADRKFGLSIGAVKGIVSATNEVDRRSIAAGHVAQRLSLETLQKPDDIAKALAMVGVPKVWSAAYPTGAAAAKTALSLVVDRRNRIVHQSDADPLAFGVPTPITATDASDAIKTVADAVRAIDRLCF